MRNSIKTLLPCIGMVYGAASMAAPILLGSVEHLYGSATGRQAESIMSVYHPGGNCDTLNTSSVTVKATKSTSCNRFADIFDFSAVGFTSIDHFDVVLSFTGAKDTFETWNVRASPDYVTSATQFGSSLTANGPQSFTFSSSNSASLFSQIVIAEQFDLSFAQNGLAGTTSSFTLASARLDVFGAAAVTEVPEPVSLALVGLGLAGLGFTRRRKQV